MSWRDRIKEAKYTAPSGTEIVFNYETVSRETELKTGVYTFPSRDGAHVQHQGAGARTFPLLCIFTGESCMDDADAFEAVLVEPGVGELQHPVYGTVKAVPTGKILREDDLISKLNESTVTITFTETITDEEASEMESVAADAVDESFDEFSEAAAADFAEGLAAIGEDDIAEQLQIREALAEQTQSMMDNLEPLASSDKKNYADWLASAKELKDKIKGLYDKGMNIAGKVESTYVKALNIARLTLRIMKLPSTLAVSLSQKLQGYANLTATLINQFKNDPFGVKNITSAFTAARLGLSGAVASIAAGAAISSATAASGGSAGSPASASGASKAGRSSGSTASGATGAPGATTAVIPDRSTGTSSREEAVATANKLTELLENITSFEDTKTAQDVFVDSNSTTYMALAELVYQSVQLVMNASFALPMQKTVTLNRDRNIIELCAELYGTVDCLDDFILENNFNIDEMEILPMGSKVTYYVQSA